MNIMMIDHDPIVAAKRLCDQHVIKMPLEAAQMLCEIARINSIGAPYKLGASHYNHPVFIWLKSDPANVGWTIRHALALCHEYTARFDGKTLKCQAVIEHCDRALTRRGLADHTIKPPTYCEAFSPEFGAGRHKVSLCRGLSDPRDITVELYKLYMDWKRKCWSATTRPMRYKRVELTGASPWRIQ